jgi:hypothetical protein
VPVPSGRAESGGRLDVPGTDVARQPRPTSTSPVWREALAFETDKVDGPLGEIALSWRLDAGSDPRIDSVTVMPDFGGVGRGTTRNDGWRTVTAESTVELERGGGSVRVAAGLVPAGAYQHVFVAARSASAKGAFGEEPLVAHVEPIARAVRVPPDARVEVDIILIALTNPSGRTQLFVKDAQVMSPPEAALVPMPLLGLVVRSTK